MILQTCAPENFRSCRWGDERTVKHAQTGSEDPHRRERNWLLFSLSELITQRVVVVVNLPSQAGTQCGQLYTNVYIHSHQNRHVKGLLSENLRLPTAQ